MAYNYLDFNYPLKQVRKKAFQDPVLEIPTGLLGASVNRWMFLEGMWNLLKSGTGTKYPYDRGCLVESPWVHGIISGAARETHLKSMEL